jgi:hypothetical protein
MLRRISVLLALLVVVGWCLAGAVPDTGSKDKTPSSPQQVQVKLSKTVTTPAVERNTPLHQALKTFGEKFEVEVVIDAKAFLNDLGVEDPREQSVELPALTGVSVRAALTKLAEQVNGVVVQEGSTVWLVPVTRRGRALSQRIEVDFEDKPVEAALKDLAARSGVNIVLDKNRAKEALKNTVTVKLAGATLENAVIIVADLAGLDAVAIDEVLYVTTEKNGERLRKVVPGLRQDPLVPEVHWRNGVGPGGVVPVPPMAAPLLPPDGAN